MYHMFVPYIFRVQKNDNNFSLKKIIVIEAKIKFVKFVKDTSLKDIFSIKWN